MITGKELFELSRGQAINVRVFDNGLPDDYEFAKDFPQGDFLAIVSTSESECFEDGKVVSYYVNTIDNEHWMFISVDGISPFQPVKDSIFDRLPDHFHLARNSSALAHDRWRIYNSVTKEYIAMFSGATIEECMQKYIAYEEHVRKEWAGK